MITIRTTVTPTGLTDVMETKGSALTNEQLDQNFIDIVNSIISTNTEIATVKTTYLPLAGGIMTGMLQNTGLNGFVSKNDDHVGHWAGTATSVSWADRGASIQLRSKNNSSAPGIFTIAAKNDTTEVSLTGSPSGTLTWGGNSIALAKDYLPLAGGTMSGSITSSVSDTIKANNTTGERRFHGGTGNSAGGSLFVYGSTHTSLAGQFRLRAATSSSIYKDLIGTPAGALTWAGSNVARGDAGDANTPVYVTGGVVTSTGKSFANYLPLAGGTMTGEAILNNTYVKARPATNNINLSATSTSLREYWPFQILRNTADTTNSSGNLMRLGVSQAANSQDFMVSIGLANPRGGNLPTASGTQTSNQWGCIGVLYDYDQNKSYPVGSGLTSWSVSDDNANRLASTAYVKACVPKSIGSATQPVYTNANGVITECTYTLEKSVPSNAVFTDTNNRVQTVATNPTSNTSYSVPFVGTSAAAQSQNYINNGLVYITREGTTSQQGTSYLQLGNATNTGTANNKKGFLRLYSGSTSYSDLLQADTTAAVTHTLPATTGTLINSGTITNYVPKSVGDANTPVYTNADGKIVSTGKSFASYLPLAGGTMTGILRVNDSICSQAAGITRGTAPSANTYRYTQFTDSAGTVLSEIRHGYLTDKTHQMALRVSNDSNNWYDGIIIKCGAAETAATVTLASATNATTQAVGNNSTRVATTAFVNHYNVLKNYGTIAAGGTLALKFDDSGMCGAVATASSALTITITKNTTINSGVLMLRLQNANTATITWSTTVNWVRATGGTTTAIATHLADMGRTALTSNGWICFWDYNGTIYGKVMN